MKFISSLFLIALLSFAACLYFPWWSIAIVAFLVVALIPQSPGKSFLTGFFAIAILWAVLSFFKSSQNEHLLAQKVAVILKLVNPALLILATALIGGLVAGFAALTASFLRKSKV